MMKRTAFLTVSLGFTGLSKIASASVAGQHMTVFRDEGCGCCEGWSAAMTAAGYSVSIEDIEHSKRLARFAIPPQLASCHTAVVRGYLVEGHVPVAAVSKLLREKPKTKGIALPGMPTGTPGMPGPRSPINVILIDAPQTVFYSA